MATAIYNFPEITKGNTFNSRKITFPFSITGACIVMQFRRRSETAVIFEWKTADNSFQIINATQVLMTSKNMDYGAYSYVYDMVVTLVSGDSFTYFEGTLKITENISDKCLI